jgi:thioredoxin
MKTLRTIAAMLAVTSICLCASMSTDAQSRKKESAKGNAVTELTSETFQTTICDITDKDASFLGDKPAIVDFTATWCGPCKKLAPILEELAVEYKGKVNIYKVDVDKCKDLAQAFRISSIPAVLFIPKDGTPQMMVGLRGKDAIRQDIDRLLLGKE